MSRSPSLPEGPTRDIDPELPDGQRLEALKAHYSDLLEVHNQLHEQLDATEHRRDTLQEKASEIERENQLLKQSSLYIATIEDIVDDEIIVKQHGNNQEVLTEVQSEVLEAAMPGDRVAVNESFGIQCILNDETDARAQAMEIEESPGVTYADIGGIDDQIREVRETVEEPLTNPEIFETVGIDPPSGVLLYGPPGTGKTMLAKAVAEETDATFIRMAGSELVRKFIGEGSRLVRDLFKMAREREPAIIFIDEIDAIAAKRTESKTSGDAEVQRTMMQLLAEMDGFSARGDIRIIAATNRFDMLDRAILRPGRFDRLIEVPKPDFDGRKTILEIHTERMTVAEDVDYDGLATETGGYSGADLASLTTEAGMFAIRDDRTTVELADFDEALEKLETDDGTDVISSAGYFYQ